VLLNTIHDFLACLITNFESQNLAFITIARISDSSDYFLLALMPSSLVDEQLNSMKLNVVTSQYVVILLFVTERP